LSPAGEYNLRLGIQKEVDPDLVATYTMPKAAAHDGHAFIVEAGVALGGSIGKEGITVYRFANRIPLLFEAGSDVATRVANRKIKWGSYKIDQKRDKVGIFVSLVSTKIPFKGTSKEYIGEDIEPIADAVRKALMQCGSQLKHHIVRREAENDAKNRRKQLTKYVPDVTKALFGIIEKVYDRDGTALGEADSKSKSAGKSGSTAGKKRSRNSLDGAAATAEWSSAKRAVLGAVHKKELTAKTISDLLTTQAGQFDEQTAAKEKEKSGRGDGSIRNVFIAPLPNEDQAPEGTYSAPSWDAPATQSGERPSIFFPELQHPAFSMRLLRNSLYAP
jgi:DNA topoisomerase-6 subunit B